MSVLLLVLVITEIGYVEYLGNIIAVTVEDLIRSTDGPAVMTYANYKNLSSRRQVLSIIRPGKGLGHPALIDFSSLPDRFKEKYVAKYGDPEAALMRQNSMITYDENARLFYATYELPDGSLLKEDKQQEYLTNASVLNKLLEMKTTQKRQRAQRGNHTPVSWDGIIEHCEQLRESYGHTLPKNAARLRDKMREYSREGYECLVSKKIGNTNTTKITDDVAEWLLAQKNSVNPIYSIGQIFSLYNEVAPEMGWKTIKSVQTLLEFFERPDIKPQWYAVGQGSQRANNLFLRQNRTIMASCRDALWYIDGTKVNLYFQYWDSKTRTTKVGTTSCIYVMDAHSEVFVGHYMCAQESFLTTYEALRNAFENTGFMPYELVSDNQAGFTSKAAKRWRAKLETISHTTTPENGKSKSIESAFGRFQNEILHQFINYTGGNITAKSSKSRINESVIVQNVKNLPTYDDVVATNEACIKKWNSMPHPKFAGKSRMEVYRESVNPHAIALTELLKEKIFYIATEKPSTFRASGLEIMVSGKKYVYEVFKGPQQPDYEWRRKNTGREFIVEYDPHDMSKVRLCIDDDNYGLQFNTWAEPYMTIHRAMQDQVEGERSGIIAALNANKKEIVRRDLEMRALQTKYDNGYESLGYDAPLPQGVTRKEYLRFAEEIRQEEAAGCMEAAQVSETLPESTAQIQKAQSNFDIVAALDRL